MKKTLWILAFLLISLIFFHIVLSVGSLVIDITSDKLVYNLGDTTQVKGNLTLDGTMVPDGLVTVRVNNPRNETTLVRTLTTGTEPPKPWAIEITEFYTCDGGGNPQPNCKLGGSVGFKVNITNNALSSYAVEVLLSIQYSNGVPFLSFTMYQGVLEGHQSTSVVTWPVSIPYDAPLGTTTAYISALANVNTTGGYAYCPEKVATFQITSGLLSGTSTPNQGSLISSVNGTFDLTLATSSHGGMLGNYTAYAISRYDYYLVTNKAIFTVRLVTDITGLYNVSDGRVDIMDLALVSGLFGTRIGDPTWDPRGDITGDGRVDIEDLARVSADYGKYGTLP
jgi:hypothetical protein